MSDLDDDFEDDNFDEDDADAKLAEEDEPSVTTRSKSLEKRRLIDEILAEKRLARELKDDLDDLDDDDDDDWDDWDADNQN